MLFSVRSASSWVSACCVLQVLQPLEYSLLQQLEVAGKKTGPAVGRSRLLPRPLRVAGVAASLWGGARATFPKAGSMTLIS